MLIFTIKMKTILQMNNNNKIIRNQKNIYKNKTKNKIQKEVLQEINMKINIKNQMIIIKNTTTTVQNREIILLI